MTEILFNTAVKCQAKGLPPTRQNNTSLNSHIWRDHSQKKMEDVKSWPVDKSLSFFTQTNYLQSENASADNVKTYYSPGYLVSQLCFSGC